MSVSVEIKKITALPLPTTTPAASAATVTVTVNQENMEEEFWAEVAGSKERLDEDEHKGNVTDEGEIEADWLMDVGLGEWTQQWRSGKSLPENDIGPAVQKLSLKPHQADAVRKRVRTLNATLKRKKNHRKTPDVRSFFQTEFPENKDSSRSATPDSLDSNEFIPSESPPRRGSSPVSQHHHASGSSADELDDVNHPNHVPNFVSIFGDGGNQQQTPSTSPPNNKNKDLFKPRFPVRGNSSVSSNGEIATDNISGIEILGYHNVGTIYMKGYIPSKKPVFQGIITPSIPSANSCPTITLHTNISAVNENPKNFSTFSATKTGFTAELNRINGASSIGGSDENEDSLNPEESYAEPSGRTRLCDLSEEDCKSIRPLILMELTAQCDHYNIQLRRKKVQKAALKKTSPTEEGINTVGIFGVPLDVILMKDRQVTGDNSLEVPIVFEKLVSHLSKRSMGEQGILRMAGQKAKINELRAIFESSLYTEPEQVDAAMNQCSSHDVSSLLKQFLREIPNPLLGYEYVDAFFEITDKLKDRSLETCIRLLILLLPQSHQAVLRQLIQFLRDLVKNSDKNKMGLKNVSLIVAPNLVPTSALGSQNKELNRAATWVRMTQTLIKYGSGLFYIPSDLLSQLRQINDRAKAKRAKNRNGNGNNNKSAASSNGNSNSGCKSGPCNYLKVSAPQLGFPDVMLPINAGTTAGEIVLSLLEEADRKAESLEKEGLQNGLSASAGNGNMMNHQGNGVVRRRPVPRSQQEVNNKNIPNLSCLLTQMNPDIALKTHSLYEIGGNIGYRRVDPSALLPAICRDNPSASWVLRCNHRHSSSR